MNTYHCNQNIVTSFFNPHLISVMLSCLTKKNFFSLINVNNLLTPWTKFMFHDNMCITIYSESLIFKIKLLLRTGIFTYLHYLRIN